VGSYEQTLKIYTITKNNGIREVDWIRNRLDLGGTFATGKLSHEVMDELSFLPLFLPHTIECTLTVLTDNR